MVNWYKKIIVKDAEHHLLVEFDGPYKPDGMNRTYPNLLNLPFFPLSQAVNTRCAELAKFVIYESPLAVCFNQPDQILNQPGADFLKIVPTVWDDIHMITGYPA